MSGYVITLSGCDDSTVFEMELSDAEFDLVKRMSEIAAKTSTYGCMPRMEIKVNPEGSDGKELG